MSRAQDSASTSKTSRPNHRRGVKAGRPKQIEEVRQRGFQTTKHTAELIDPDKPLSDKQKLFVKLWAQGESIVTATERAGFQNSPTYGYRLVRQPNVLALYHEEKAKYEASVQMTRKKVMDGLLEGVEMAKMAGEPASVIAGWREIGKMCGYYEPVTKKLDITVSGNVVLDRMNRLSDAELLKLIEGEITAEASHDDHPDD